MEGEKSGYDYDFSKTEYNFILNCTEQNLARKVTKKISIRILPIKSSVVSVIFGKQIMWVDDIWQKKKKNYI